jgi:hypothetical protein
MDDSKNKELHDLFYWLREVTDKHICSFGYKCDCDEGLMIFDARWGRRKPILRLSANKKIDDIEVLNSLLNYFRK